MIQAHRRAPKGRLKIRLYLRNHCPQHRLRSGAIATRLRLTNAHKHRSVLAATFAKTGEIGAQMRREYAYSSSLATWWHQYAAGNLSDRGQKKRGPMTRHMHNSSNWPQ